MPAASSIPWRSKILRCAFLAFLPFNTPCSAAELAIQAPDTVEELLKTHLDLSGRPLESENDQQAVLFEARRRIADLLATEGYFSPTVEGYEKTQDDETLFVLEVEPGPRTRVRRVEIEFPPSFPSAEAETLRKNWSLRPERGFRQAAWESAKDALLSQLSSVDFAEAKIVESRAEIDPETRSADLFVRLDPGPRYMIGETLITGLDRYKEDLIARYTRRVQKGSMYREAEILSLQNTLQSTPYFSSAVITLDTAAAQPLNEEYRKQYERRRARRNAAAAANKVEGADAADSTEQATPEEADSAENRESAEIETGETVLVAPLRIVVRERRPHRFGAGAGFSSNTGARVSFTYTTADLFHRAWELRSGIRLEQKQQTAYADIFFPPDGRSVDSVGAIAESSNISGLKTNKTAFGAIRTIQRRSTETRWSLNWIQEVNRISGQPDQDNHALTPNLMYTWRKVDNPVDPRDGYVLMAQVGGGAKPLLSTQTFIRVNGRMQWFQELSRREVLTLRGELGGTFANSREGIPQDWLFRTGGAQTIRGYSYQSLGIKQGDAVVGARYLAIFSAEITHWLRRSNWGVAAFIDTGNARDKLNDFKFATGAGIGARWKSPAGPIAADLAYGFETHGIQLHLSLAIPF
ncbi:MAG: BamA/TamA family outer membrane protein [Betaproteobacteria bacterium]|nr:BamA/TamA family outer membrane protein [Betaproteobacteria bacterium]